MPNSYPEPVSPAGHPPTTDVPGDPLRRRTGMWLAIAVLSLAVCGIYVRAIDTPFICDDIISIVENTSLRQLWPLWGDDARPGPLNPETDVPTCGRPLVNLTFALNYGAGELDPRGYRGVNIALHVANALLFAALVRRTLLLPYFGGKFAAAAGPLAFLAALMWAVHPLVTEAVVYLTQRTELAVSFCYLATLYSSLRYWTTEHPRQRRVWLTLAVFASFAGMASKEVMATAPVMVLLFDRTFLSGTVRKALRQSLPLYLGLAASWAIVIALAARGPRAASAGFHLDVSATQWWLTQTEVLLMYLKLAVWPWPLAIHYERPYLDSLREAWPSLVPVALLVVGTLVLLWRRSAVGYALACVFAILAPTLIVPITTEVAAERRMYLPLAVLIALAVAGGYSLLRRVTDPRAALVGVAAVALPLACVAAVVSAERLAVYHDELTLWQDVLAHQPHNATAHYNTGTTYLERGEPQAARAYLERAIEIRPTYAKAHHNLGAVFSSLGEYEEAQAQFERAVELRPEYALAHLKLGILALKAGRAEEAQRQFEEVVHWQPNDAEGHTQLAITLLSLDQLDEARAHARRALENAPTDAAAQNDLGAAFARAGRYGEAVEHLEVAVRLDPKLLQAQGNLMAAYAAAGRMDEALATGRKALESARASGQVELAAQIENWLQHYEKAP